MPSLKEIRSRIGTVSTTRKITGAMKMVSAAKFHKAQEAVVRFEPFARRLLEVLALTLGDHREGEVVRWLQAPAGAQREALIVITSNSSLCGGFNQNLIRMLMETAPALFAGTWLTPNLDVYCLGRRGAEALVRQSLNVVATDTMLVDRPHFPRSSAFVEGIMANYVDGVYGRVHVAYNRYRNPAVQTPQVQQFLPLLLPEKLTERVSVNPDTIFEPTREEVIGELIPRCLKILFHGYLLDSALGEHGARMTAMHQATDNATGLIKSLTLQYNKVRQAAITKEILEVVSGAEALKGARRF